jgi:hypothetical protein
MPMEKTTTKMIPPIVPPTTAGIWEGDELKKVLLFLLTKSMRVEYHLEPEPGFDVGDNDVTTALPDNVGAVV